MIRSSFGTGQACKSGVASIGPDNRVVTCAVVDSSKQLCRAFRSAAATSLYTSLRFPHLAPPPTLSSRSAFRCLKARHGLLARYKPSGLYLFAAGSANNSLTSEHQFPVSGSEIATVVRSFARASPRFAVVGRRLRAVLSADLGVRCVHARRT